MRKKLIYTILGAFLLPTTIYAQNNTTRFFPQFAKETLTISSTALPFTSSVYRSTSNPVNTAQIATFTVTCASGTSCAIRFWIEGSTPTSAQGLRAAYGDSVTVYGLQTITNFRAIREISTDAIIDVTYGR
jgi:hypothetical protein